MKFSLAIICILLIILFLLGKSSESFINNHRPIVYLSEESPFNTTLDTRTWVFSPEIDYSSFGTSNESKENGYTKSVIRMQLRYYEINVPLLDSINTPFLSEEKRNLYNNIRHVELWSLHPNVAGVSPEDVYKDDYYDRIYNKFKYRKIVEVRAGEIVRGEALFPIQQVLVVAVL